MRTLLRIARVVSVTVAFSAAAGAAPRKGRPRPAEPRTNATTPAPAVATPAPARRTPGTSVDVTVTEIAGGQAYLKPGTAGGVLRGAKVSLRGKPFTVVQATSTFAVIDIAEDAVRENDRGQAVVVNEEEEKPTQLPAPQPLARWERAWPEPEPPASRQTPKYVPLSIDERDKRWDIRFSTLTASIIPLGSRGESLTRAEINARIHAEPFSAPFAFDADVSVQRWFAPNIDARQGSESRPMIWVREFLATYGSRGGVMGSVGRMRYASSMLGTLDGARVTIPAGAGFSVSAFGGALPHPLSGAPALVAQRLGIETTYARPDTELRPEAALTLHGSTFDGDLDERRISAMVGVYPGHTRVGGHAEVSQFSSDNPWKASPVELTAAGVDASTRLGVFRLGGRLDVRQPVRSRWLLSYLPLSWFCRTTPDPAAPTGPEICDGTVSTRAMAAADAGFDAGPVSLTVGATQSGDLTQGDSAPTMTGGFAAGRIVRIGGIARVDVSATYGAATMAETRSLTFGPGVSLFADRLDLGAYYRYAVVAYRSDRASLTQSAVGGTILLLPSSIVLATVQAEAMKGDDANALLVLASLVWRPRL